MEPEAGPSTGESMQPEPGPSTSKSMEPEAGPSTSESMEPEAGPSTGESKKRRRRRNIFQPQQGSDKIPFTSPTTKRRKTVISSGERSIIINVFKYVTKTKPEDKYMSNHDLVKLTSEMCGVHERSVYNVLNEYRDTHKITEPERKRDRPSVIQKIDNLDKSAIRRIVHSFFLKGELPTLKKIQQAVNDHESLPTLSMTSLRRIMKHLKFKYTKRNRKSVLIDRGDIVSWRIKYLKQIKQFREENRRIFYTDETWVNADMYFSIHLTLRVSKQIGSQCCDTVSVLKKCNYETCVIFRVPYCGVKTNVPAGQHIKPFKTRAGRCNNYNLYLFTELYISYILCILGHTVGKTWVDENIKSAKQAFKEGLSIGAKNPVSKGKRLIVVHVGNEEGFLDDCKWVFEAKKTGDYHENMDAPHFEKWFGKVLTKMQPEDVIVLDNASYHSRREERTPTMQWRKGDIQGWLRSKNILYDDKYVKKELMDLVNPVKEKYQSYVIDEMAKKKDITVLRLPPYHCELNPIELIWADIKGYVARNNTTFNFKDLKKLVEDGIEQVTKEKWANCVEHVKKEEKKMCDLDHTIDKTMDKFIINVTDSSSESSEYSSSSEEEIYE
ncbi:uncharacterized protein LOC133525293 [Cydia pomonella]|uniref:uncharacterized protein LOC133525293 n=1 Tax=Cydia pomonella TaxID=82600 RepID=UPI002ADDCE31|nr:uncharacterized protein LOC133525293 [Cydia pomonella]